MIDIHSHILPGLDDGSQSLEQSAAMLSLAAESGTTDIVATPHANEEFAFRPDVIHRRVCELRSFANGRIRIHVGCDFHLSFSNIEDALRNPSKYTINNGCYLLVEFSDISVFGANVSVFSRLRHAGMIPIITHPERNSLLRSRINDLQKWVGDGCLIQVTAQSFLGGFGRPAKQFADLLLAKNLVHFIASDAHDCEHRPPRLDQSYMYVLRKAGPAQADLLFREYPQRVVDGDPIYPEELIPPKRKWFQRWLQPSAS
jgi:protein-tyrosine phosphatase